MKKIRILKELILILVLCCLWIIQGQAQLAYTKNQNRTVEVFVSDSGRFLVGNTLEWTVQSFDYEYRADVVISAFPGEFNFLRKELFNGELKSWDYCKNNFDSAEKPGRKYQKVKVPCFNDPEFQNAPYIKVYFDLTIFKRPNKDSKCDKINGKDHFYFVVIMQNPRFIGPEISPVSGVVCPNTEVLFKVEKYHPFLTSNPSVYPIYPDQAIWYLLLDNTDLNINKEIGRGDSLLVRFGEGETKAIAAKAIIKDNACYDNSLMSIPSVLTSLLYPLTPPLPKYGVACGDEEVCISYQSNLLNYTGMYWYDSKLDDPLDYIHDGFSFCHKPSGALNSFFVRYYNDKNGCRQYSDASPVFFIKLPQLNTNLPNFSTVEIYDWRDVNASDCETERDPLNHLRYPFYHDLPSTDALNISTALTSQLNTFLGVLNNTGYIKASSENVYGAWRAMNNPHNASEEFKVRQDELGQDIYRVCAENIQPDQEASEGERRYYLELGYSFNMEVYSSPLPLSGIPDTSKNKLIAEELVDNCALADRFVRNIVLRDFSNPEGEICRFPDESLINEFYNGESCLRRETHAYCDEDEFVVIGPTEEQVFEMLTESAKNTAVIPQLYHQFTTYQWSPEIALEDPKKARAKVYLNQLPIEKGEIFNYKLYIRYSPPGQNPVEVDYCAYLYRCGNCNNLNEADVETIVNGLN